MAVYLFLSYVFPPKDTFLDKAILPDDAIDKHVEESPKTPSENEKDSDYAITD